MKKSQIIVAIAALGLVAILYFGVSNIPPKHAEQAPVAARDAEAGHQHETEVASITFDELLAKGKKDLSEAQKKTLDDITLKKDEKVRNEALVHFWTDAKKLHLAAKYNEMRAELENTEKSRTFAARFYIDLFNAESDEQKRHWEAEQAIALLQKVVASNPDNEEAKVDLALCFVEGTGAAMQGVTLLREVVAKNPAHENAGLQLGRLAIKSGQFDKAKDRLEKLVEIYPKNAEAHYYLAMSYKGLGEVDKAKKVLQQCKTLVKDPKFGEEIDAFIKSF